MGKPDDFDDFDDDYEDDWTCDHEGHDVDILTGRAHCFRCGHSWFLTSEELEYELKIHAEWAEQYDEEHSRP